MAGRGGFGKMVIGQTGRTYGLHRPGGAKPKIAASVFGDLGEDDASGEIDSTKVVMGAKHQEKMARRQVGDRCARLASRVVGGSIGW
jgi:hypothetical protein